MALGNWNIQWLNQNSQRSYPLTDASSGQDTTGTIQIPDSFMLSLQFSVHAGNNVQPEKFFIHTLSIFPIGYSIVLGYDDGTASPPVVGNVNISRINHYENRAYAISGTGNFADSTGTVIIGNLAEVDTLPTGTYSFAPAAATIETDAIRPMIRGISSITVVNGTDRSDPIYGDVEITAGTNMRIVANIVEGQSPDIVFNAISGEGLNETCGCDETSDGPPIRFINGIPPLPDGNFRIVGNNCMDVQPVSNGLRFSDLCSEPCCGCVELEALTSQIDKFADGVVTLQGFANALNVEVTQMSQVVLGSRLNDNGCINC